MSCCLLLISAIQRGIASGEQFNVVQMWGRNICMDSKIFSSRAQKWAKLQGQVDFHV